MTNILPPDPESSPKTPLGFDEFIAILVAFGAIAAILFWSFSRRDSSWNFNGLISPSPSTQSNQPSSPAAQARPNSTSNFNALPSPVPTTVIEPKTTLPPGERVYPSSVLPSPNVVATQLPQEQKFISSLGGWKSSITSLALPPVTPAKEKSTIPPPIAFNDVPDNFWGRRFINVLSSRGILKGFPDYSFRPNQSVNRAEFAAILEKAFSPELRQPRITFKDVPTKFWATPAINQAISNKFLKGYPDKTFKPGQKISRVQVLVALTSGLNLKEPSTPAQVLSIYKDAKDIPQYAVGKIAAATTNGLVVNYPDQQALAPNRPASRAEVAAMIHQALVKLGKLEAIPSQNIVRQPSSPAKSSPPQATR
ncbi:MAG: S-layer homology domain-containing protein [Desmonostoc vinosum HA7617-LM4]|jgi:hypothetical protein|nr:S-layer homology domain-containing protein [Desmonostoc vinosum HA7617-LM4]